MKTGFPWPSEGGKADITNNRFTDYTGGSPGVDITLPDNMGAFYSVDTSVTVSKTGGGVVSASFYGEQGIDVFSTEILVLDSGIVDTISANHFRIPPLTVAKISSTGDLELASTDAINLAGGVDVTLTGGDVVKVVNTIPPWANVKDFKRVMGYRYYELSNHLGNVHAVVNDRKIGVDDGVYNTSGTQTSSTADDSLDYYLADVVSYSDYYPFGSLMPNRHGNADEYRYGFNGMEMDNEVKDNTGAQYNTANRGYDPRIGRWLSLDPVKRHHISPYSSMSNNPIARIDPEGDDDYYNKAGKYVGSDGVGNAIRITGTPTKEKFNKYLESQGAEWMKSVSKEVTIDPDAVPILKKMYETSVKDNYEVKAYIILDVENATLSVEIQERTDGDDEGHSNNVWDAHTGGEAGDYNTAQGEGNSNKVIIAQAHVHPGGENKLPQFGSSKKLGGEQLKMGASRIEDKQLASDLKSPVYAIDVIGIHKVDQKGKFTNNIPPEKVMKDALETNG